jgi:P-type E1-E2 ATPase
MPSVPELIDDLGRRNADRKANSRLYGVLRQGRVIQVPSSDIHVGDIVKLTCDDEIPCDLVVLSTSDPLGNCFIQVRRH